jgi:hypothetical protein
MSESQIKQEDSAEDDVEMSSNSSDVRIEGYNRRHNSSAEVHYTPELALEEGLAMLKAMKANIQRLSSKDRKEDWMRDIEQ